ncbi:MAG: SET domain-containing protein-lysine N-methyltransferase [Kiritimatiellia bacterium]
MIRIGDCGKRGRGIFAARPIAGGEVIDVAPVVVVPQAQVPQLDATPLGDYYFVWGEERKDAAILLGHCSLCNHSYEPNARFELRPDHQSIAFLALRDIAAGEEITINYNGNPACRDPLWFPTHP